MSGLRLLRDLARNNAWSNLRIHQACAALSDDAMKQQRVSFFPTLLSTLAHILIVDWYYVDGLEGVGRGRSVFAREIPYETLPPTTEAQRAVDARLIAFCDALPDEAALDRMVALDRRDGPHHDRVADVLMHLFVHQIHHRGQVHAMLSGTEVKPPQLDEFFLADERPIAMRELQDARR